MCVIFSARCKEEKNKYIRLILRVSRAQFLLGKCFCNDISSAKCFCNDTNLVKCFCIDKYSTKGFCNDTNLTKCFYNAHESHPTKKCVGSNSPRSDGHRLQDPEGQQPTTSKAPLGPRQEAE